MAAEYLDANELASLLRTSKAGLYALKYRGELPPASRIGRRLLWNRLEVERWLQDCREPAARSVT